MLRYPNKYNKEITSACEEFSVSPQLVRGIIWAESKFDKTAVSKAGAIGLMQLMPQTAIFVSEMLNEELDINMLYDANTNIRLGVYYLSYLLMKFDERNAVAAYNAGEGNVTKWISQNLTYYPYKETADYVERVFRAKTIYKYRA